MMTAYFKLSARSPVMPILAVHFLLIPIGAAPAQDPALTGLRAQAVTNLSFDEPMGDALDSAAMGAVKDVGKFVNVPVRVKSPFPGQKGKQALLLEAGRKQFVQLEDSADLDRGEGLSLSFFFLSLTAPDDPAAYGIVAKRIDEKPSANYGINYVAKSDIFQLYVNDGTGFAIASFSSQSVLGSRRPVFLTATVEIGDAPAPDADTDRDDLLVRLFVNGQPLAPKGATRGAVTGNEAWLTDLKLAGLLNDAPVTIGSSTPAIEFVSGLLDEFSLFPRALTPAEAAKLFSEVAGPEAALVATEEAKPAPLPPEITGLSRWGVQVGQTTTVAITGSNLLPAPLLMFPVPITKLVVGPSSNAGRLEVELSIAGDVPTGIFPLRIQTAHGVSNPLPIAIDSLPEIIADESSREKPLATPVAVSGLLAGSQQTRVYFNAKAGQNIIVDVESKRLGAGLTPVLEVKNVQGTPLTIQWGQIEFHGDPRAAFKVPADGVYVAELHDLAYQAPAGSPFRIKIGELKLLDAVFPLGVSAGTQGEVALIGPGLDPAIKLPIDLRGQSVAAAQALLLPGSLGISGAAPSVLVSMGQEVTETLQAPPSLQSVDARFVDLPIRPMVINGRIAQRREQDRFLLQVTPNQKLSLAIATRSIHSPLDPRIMILKHPEGTPLAAADDPGVREPALEFAVPADVNAIQVAIRDIQGRGGASSFYRLRIAPAGQPDFSLTLSADRLHLAQDGSALLRLEVLRVGYNGPIKLTVAGDAQLALTPSEIPAGINSSWLTLSRKAGAAASSFEVRTVQLLGESVDLNPPLRRLALSPNSPALTMFPGARGGLMLGLLPPQGYSLELGAVPASLFKGVEVNLPLTLILPEQSPGRVARLSLVSTEASRPNVPNNPAQPTKPKVDAPLGQVVDVGEKQGTLRIDVPTDVAEPSIEFVIKGELIQHSYASSILGTAYTRPFRLPVQAALTVQPAATTLNLVSEVPAKFNGTIKRTPGFAGAVDISLLNLPAGYTAPKLTLAPDQETFELLVTAPVVPQAADIPNIVLRIAGASGVPLQPDVAIATKVAPK